MRRWHKSAGLVFLAASSVYSVSAKGAVRADAVIPNDAPAPADAPAPSKPDQSLPTVIDAPSPEAPKLTTGPVTTFSIQINSDTPLRQVLDMIAGQAQISVIPSKEVQGTVPAMDLYNVTLPQALDAIFQNSHMGYQQKGNFIYVYSQREMAAMQKAARVPDAQVFHLHYLPASAAATLIKPALSNSAKVSFVATPDVENKSSDGNQIVAADSPVAADDTLVVTDFPENLDKVRDILKQIDRRPRQIIIEATILRLTPKDHHAKAIDFSKLSNLTIGSTDFATFLDPHDSRTNPAAAHRAPSIGVIQNHLELFLRALQSVADTTIVANPKVLALDKQAGELRVGRKDGYLTATSTPATPGQKIAFLETGTRLIFRPFIENDGYIRIEIQPQESTGGFSAANLPYKITTQISSNVLVKTGGTIVISGLYREANEHNTATHQEVVILLTPHVVEEDSTDSQISQAKQKQLKPLEVGTRPEMQASGRQHLAEIAFEQAVTEMKTPTPDISKALWHLDCAINLNPQYTDAIALRQQLISKTLAMNDHSMVRDFLRQEMLQPHALVPTTRPDANPPTPADRITLAPDQIPGRAESTQPSPATITAQETPPAIAPSGNTIIAMNAATRPDITQINSSPTNEVEVRVLDDNDMQNNTAPPPATQPAGQADIDVKAVTVIPIEPDATPPPTPAGK